MKINQFKVFVEFVIYYDFNFKILRKFNVAKYTQIYIRQNESVWKLL